MVWLIYTPEYHYYLLRRWTGKLNPRFHLFDHNGVLEFEPTPDTLAQVLWAYAMRMGVDLLHVYESVVSLIDADPSSNARSDEYQLLGNWIRTQIVQLRNNGH